MSKRDPGQVTVANFNKCKVEGGATTEVCFYVNLFYIRKMLLVSTACRIEIRVSLSVTQADGW